jgi:hypothetical protein
LGAAGCFVSFPAEVDTTTQEGDTTLSTDTETGSSSSTLDTSDPEDSDTSSSTIVPPCPKEVVFLEPPTLTQIAASKTDQGIQYVDSCPHPQVLVGFRGTLVDKPEMNIDVHGRFQAICGTLVFQSNRHVCHVLVQEGDTLPERGGAGDIEWERMCPTNQVLAGFYAQAGAEIDQLTFSCAPLHVQQSGNGLSLSLGLSSALPPIGKSGGTLSYGPIECPEGELATIAHIKATQYVTSLALGCQKPSTVLE